MTVPTPRTLEGLAWAAGLFEGEGTFTIRQAQGRSDKCYVARVKMTDYDIIRRLQHTLGFGYVRLSSAPPIGHKQQYQWEASRFEYFQATVALFWRWLGVRRRKRAVELLLDAKLYHRKQG